MNQKFKLATKRITAVAASAALVSSAVAGAPLANYPSNFVDNGEFNGTVVVGSDAASSDMTAAESLISDLESEFSGEQNKVRIDYREESEGGETVSAVDSRETLNFGETLESVREDLDDSSSDMFQDEELDNDVYNQELFLKNGSYEHRIFDEVDGEDTAKDGIYFNALETFAEYDISFEDTVDINDDDARGDLIGEEMTIMGNQFTVESIDADKLTLIGGSNKMTVGEGESQTVTVDGEEYEVEVQSVSDKKTLLSVNGESMTIDELDTEQLGGVNVAVTELVPSSRDSVQGYAEFVIGGQKVSLDGNDVEINDEELDDMYDDYQVDVSWDQSTEDTEFSGLTLEYKVDENTVLGEGDSLRDVLFDSFELRYDGTNDVEYSTLDLSSDDSGVTFDGNLYNGDSIPSEFELTTDDVDGDSLYLGSRNKRIYHSGSDLAIKDLVDADRMRAINISNTNETVEFNVSATTSDVQDNMFYSYIDDEESYLYQFAGVDRDDSEFDFEDLIGGQSTSSVEFDQISDDLEVSGSFDTATNSQGDDISELTTDSLGNSSMHLENFLEMDFNNVEAKNFAFDGGNSSELVFSYNSDIDMDDNENETDSFALNFTRSQDPDDAIKINVDRTNNDFVNDDETEENSDYDVYVDHYGTMLTLETEDNDEATIEVPEEEVHGQANVVFGDSSSEEMSVTVDESALEDERERLEEEGYTITGTEDVESEEVEFDIDGAITDSEADLEAGNHIVIGGPAVNAAARAYLGIDEYTVEEAGVEEGEGVARYFEDSNSVLIYGYSAEDTTAMVDDVIEGEADFE